MIAHTPTLFACVALVATLMAFCLILVGQFNRRDSLLTIGFGLLARADAALYEAKGMGRNTVKLAAAAPDHADLGQIPGKEKPAMGSTG